MTLKAKWQAESDHDTTEEAAERVHFLNGGSEALLKTVGLHKE